MLGGVYQGIVVVCTICNQGEAKREARVYARETTPKIIILFLCIFVSVTKTRLGHPDNRPRKPKSHEYD